MPGCGEFNKKYLYYYYYIDWKSGAAVIVAVWYSSPVLLEKSKNQQWTKPVNLLALLRLAALFYKKH